MRSFNDPYKKSKNDGNNKNDSKNDKISLILLKIQYFV